MYVIHQFILYYVDIVFMLNVPLNQDLVYIRPCPCASAGLQAKQNKVSEYVHAYIYIYICMYVYTCYLYTHVKQINK